VIDKKNKVVAEIVNPDVALMALRHFVGHRVAHSADPLELSELLKFAKCHFEAADEGKVLALMFVAGFDVPELEHDRCLMA